MSLGVRVDDLTDAEVAAGFRDGDEACLAEAYARWASLVHTVAMRSLGNREDAEDVTQAVFVAAWRGRERYTASAGTLAGWLLGITRHTVADRWAATARDQKVLRAVGSVTVPSRARRRPSTTSPIACSSPTSLSGSGSRPSHRRAGLFDDLTHAQIADHLICRSVP
jgi:RNA polymerase sigma-70 factor (ECF subfamily)